MRSIPAKHCARRVLAALALACLAGCAPSPHDLAAAGDAPRLEALLQSKKILADSQGPGRKRPLHYAATHGQLETMRVLLKYKINIDSRDETGLTPLHCAAVWDRIDAAGMLLDAGAKLDVLDNFRDSPVHLAAMHDRPAMIEFLAGRGANLRLLNKEGKSALDLAIEQRKAGAAAALREALKTAPPAPDTPPEEPAP